MPLKALKGPQIEFSHILMHRPTKPEIFMPLPLSVLSQSGPPKSVFGCVSFLGWLPPP